MAFITLPIKTILVSTGVVSIAVILKLSLPVILDILTLELPLLWSLALSWLQPPYLYLLINCIILSIVASSKLHPRGNEVEKFSDVGDPMVVEEVEKPLPVVFGYVNDEKTPVKAGVEPREEREGDGGGDDEFVVSRSLWTPMRRDTGGLFSPVSSTEKLPVSARFGHRRGIKASPEGKAHLKVSRPKRKETLESTWRTITEGRPIPLTRHLKKSDIFAGASHDASSVRVMKKSDTFNGNSSPASSSGGKMRRESSLSQDELNRRVEAFIKKFNEEMRMQRQESLNQYKEMVDRGTH